MTVSADGVAAPVAVRYGWDADPKCDLVNAAGLPASPFRVELERIPPTCSGIRNA